MSNGHDSGNGGNGDSRGGGGFIGGFSQPGFRESKNFTPQTEVKIPRLQFWEIFLATLALTFLGYICLKLVITTRADWSLAIGVASFIAIPAFFIFFERMIAYRFFPNVYDDILNLLHRMVSTDDPGRFLLFAFFASIAILLSLGFYIGIIVPQLIMILDQEAQIVFVFLAFFSFLVAYRPYYVYNRRQLEDTLRDSDSRYAIESLKIENENQKQKQDAIRALRSAGIGQLPPGNPESEFVDMIPMKRLATKPTAKLTPAQERWKTIVFDFLDGIDNGWWDTTERSWRNVLGEPKILEKSGQRLLRFGRDIRDYLIEANLAAWKDVHDEKQGWRLSYTTQEIRDEAFNYDGQLRTRTDGAGSSDREGDESDSETSDWDGEENVA